MPDSRFSPRDAIAAEIAATEIAILAEQMRGIGALFASAALDELARARRARAETIKALARNDSFAAQPAQALGSR